MTGARTPLRVLYLTPPAAGATALAAQSFVDEEIRAIASWDVAPYVLTDVVTDSGGPSEYVEHGVNGFVVPVGDSQALAMRVDDLLQDARLRAEMSENARRRIERRHGYERMMRDLRSIYEEACGIWRPCAASV